MLCNIYKITNQINGKIYVGQTWKNIQYRFSEHKSARSHCIKLVNAFDKHDRKNFTITLITVCATQTTADYWETYFIKQYDSIVNGYNLKDGGANGKTNEETKRKLSIALKGRPAPNKGIPATPETISKLSKMRKGVKKSEEHKANMKLAQNTPESKAARSKAMSNKTWTLVNGKRIYTNKIIE